MRASRIKVIAGYCIAVGVTLIATVWCSRPTPPGEVSSAGPTHTLGPLTSLFPTSGRQQLSGHISKEIAAAPVIERVPPETRLHLAISLPVKDRAALRQHVRDVSDPKSPTFRHHITKEQFGEQHGASASDYEAVASWAEANHLVVERHANRLVVTAVGAVSDIETALDLHFNYATRPDGSKFVAPDREPSLALAVPVSHVDGLDGYRVLKANGPPAPHGNGKTPQVDGSITATDLRHAYLSGIASTLNGAGQQVCVVEGAICINLPDLSGYAATFDGGSAFLTSNVTFNGGSYNCPDGQADNSGEFTQDLEMIIAMAPGASIFVGGAQGEGTTSDWTEMLQAFADQPCKQISSSFGGPGANGAGNLSYEQEALVNEFALQGQSYFMSGGDQGAWTVTNGPEFPTALDEAGALQNQAITIVGGTFLNMSDGGTWQSEYPWTPGPGVGSSGGGILPPENLPYYQYAAAIGNQSYDGGASLTFRNGPDAGCQRSRERAQRTSDADLRRSGKGSPGLVAGRRDQHLGPRVGWIHGARESKHCRHLRRCGAVRWLCQSSAVHA